MKIHLLTLVFYFLAVSCSNDDSFHAKLPPETQIGANTFGVTIKGKVYVPRTPTGHSVGTSPEALILWGTSDNSWYEIEAKDGASAVGFNMIIHMQPLVSVGQMILHQSNFDNSVDSTPFTHIYFKIWDQSISNYAYYGSIENQGEINITKLSGGLISGNFKGKFIRYNEPYDIIEITDGRFDINGFTLPDAVFP